jgi:hypothetical protein
VVDKLAGRTPGLTVDSPSEKIIRLADSMNPLKLRFNNAKEKIRFLALLSPTCPL